MSDRDAVIERWVAEALGTGARLEPASADASFRRYLRVRRAGSTFVLMDAPPEHEDCRPFVAVADLLHRAGLRAPRIHHADLARGLLLLEDLGERCYLAALQDGSADALYREAMAALARMQARVHPDTVPHFDRERLMDELALFRDWFLARHLGLEGAIPAAVIEDCFEGLCERCLEQPQVFVHRDYHSRNLMCLPDGGPGILDFQDAVRGPAGYDLASLLRDAYVAWPRDRVRGWALGFLDLARAEGLYDGVDGPTFVRWMDLAGLQRQLKVAGIFCRLWYRDGKPGYLADIPRTLGYFMAVAPAYAETRALASALAEAGVLERLRERNHAVAARAGAAG